MPEALPVELVPGPIVTQLLFHPGVVCCAVGVIMLSLPNGVATPIPTLPPVVTMFPIVFELNVALIPPVTNNTPSVSLLPIALVYCNVPADTVPEICAFAPVIVVADNVPD